MDKRRRLQFQVFPLGGQWQAKQEVYKIPSVKGDSAFFRNTILQALKKFLEERKATLVSHIKRECCIVGLAIFRRGGTFCCFQLGKQKAPKLNCFTIALFQECRDVIKGDLMMVLLKFQNDGIINQSTNITFFLEHPWQSSNFLSKFCWCLGICQG